jgi:hypothetical protein
MNSIKHACSLNNQGVDLLVAGESSRAMKAFQSAVGLLKTAVHEAEKSAYTGMMTSNDDVSLSFCESTLTVSGLQGIHNGYVYEHGIMIPGNVNAAETEATICLYIAIVLFNLALASHCEGTALGKYASLKKASVLYSLVVQLLNRRETTPEDESSTILTLLALNNKAQIHYDQCDFIQSVDCMNNVSHIIGSGRGLHFALNPDDIEGLLLNVMLLRTPSVAQAA